MMKYEYISFYEGNLRLSAELCSAAEGLRDGRGKPGEGLWRALCRTWNGQPELKMMDADCR